MHRALQLPEVVHLVVKMLDCPTEKMNKRTLLNVSLTCRAFSEPALDVLWYSMVSLKPLFNLLSNFKSLDDLDPSRSKDSLPWGSISEDDLRMVEKYASRIRCYHHGSTGAVSTFAYIHLLQATGQSHLLPNLVSLNVNLNAFNPDSATVCGILFLISPSLRRFYTNTVKANLLPVLNSIQTRSPNLSVVDLSAGVFSAHWMSAICSLPRLQELTINIWAPSAPAIEIDFFTRLSCHQTLRQLSISGEVSLVVNSNKSFGQGPVAFPALESIDFDCALASINPISTLLNYVTLPLLRSLHVAIETSAVEPSADERRHWSQFFIHLGTVTTDRFKALDISDLLDNPDDSLWKDLDLTIGDFLGLDRLRLEKFVLRGRILHSIHNNDVEKMFKAWPALQELRLTCFHPFALHFDVLLNSALSLPYLESLSLPMDLQEKPSPKYIPLLSHPLTTLKLEVSSLQRPDLKDIVQSIDKIFPKLVHLSIVKEDEDDDEDGDGGEDEDEDAGGDDEEAKLLLSMLQEARQHETQRVVLAMSCIPSNDVLCHPNQRAANV